MNEDITIERIISPHLLTCPPDIPLREAARCMHGAHCSSILVEQNGAIIGIWTERDVLAIDLNAPESLLAPISSHMSAPVRTLRHDTRLGEAAMRFREENIRHFLVVDEADRPLGLISQSDIVANQGMEYYLSLREVRAVANREYQALPSTAALDEVRQKMRNESADAVIINYPDGEHGILTERDFMRLLGSGRQAARAGEVASRPVISVPVKASLYHAHKLFIEMQVRHLGVTDGRGRLWGMLAYSDLLASIENDYINQLRDTLRERDHSLTLAYQHQRLATKVFECALEGIMVTNARHIIESINPAFTQITGYKAHEVIGQTPALLASGRHDATFYREMREQLVAHGQWQGEIWNRRKSGEVYPEWLTINAVRAPDNRITNYVGVFSDISKRKVAEERMAFMAHHDGLTSLPNRSLFMDRLSHAIALAQRNQARVAVMFLDLDNFKQVNDTLGHHVGDQLLQIVAQRLVACVRETDTVARLGGDEFTIVLESVADTEVATAVARKIIDTLNAPVMLDEHTLSISTSIGLSLYPDHADNAEALVQAADMAMYAAKNGGRSHFRLYTADMRAQARLLRLDAAA